MGDYYEIGGKPGATPASPSSDPFGDNEDGKNGKLKKSKYFIDAAAAKKNKSKSSQIKNPDAKSKTKSIKTPSILKSEQKSGEPGNDGKKKKGNSGEDKSGAISIVNKPSGENGGKHKRKMTAQEIIADRQLHRGSKKKDMIVSSILIVSTVIVIIITILGIGAVSDFEFGAL